MNGRDDHGLFELRGGAAQAQRREALPQAHSMGLLGGSLASDSAQQEGVGVQRHRHGLGESQCGI